MTPALSADKREGIPIQEQTNKNLQVCYLSSKQP
jgi:hypothetical protein